MCYNEIRQLNRSRGGLDLLSMSIGGLYFRECMAFLLASVFNRPDFIESEIPICNPHISLVRHILWRPKYQYITLSSCFAT